MNELQVFKHEVFGSIRTLEINNEPWFVGKDVATALGFSNSRDAIKKHVFEEDKGVDLIDTLGGKQNMTIINESGLYALVFGSRLKSASQFKRWVTSEVLPSIRKHGAYLTDKKAYDITHNKDALADLLLQAGQQLKEKDLVIQQKEKVIKEMAPKVLFADCVEISENSILIGQLAKMIKQNGYDIGQKRLFEWMRDNGYLCNAGASRNLPTQKAMNLGLFEIKERTVTNPDGSVRLTRTTTVTGKGQRYFINKFLAGDDNAL